MSKTSFWIGCSGYPVDRGRYQGALNFVELQDTRRALPREDTIRKLKSAAPEGFRYGLVAPEALCDPEAARELPGGPAAHGGMRPTPANIELLDRTLAAAAALGAVVRLHTTSDLNPGPDAFERFRALLNAVDRRGVPLAWEQRGALKDKELVRWAEKLDLMPVLDPFQDAAPTGPLGFVRIHPFMTFATGLHAEQLVKIAERLLRHEQAFAVFDTPSAFREARALRRLLAGGPSADPEPEAGDDEPDDEADDDEAGDDEAGDDEAGDDEAGDDEAGDEAGDDDDPEADEGP